MHWRWHGRGMSTQSRWRFSRGFRTDTIGAPGFPPKLHCSGFADIKCTVMDRKVWTAPKVASGYGFLPPFYTTYPITFFPVCVTPVAYTLHSFSSFSE
jgi:hypothetical protein